MNRLTASMFVATMLVSSGTGALAQDDKKAAPAHTPVSKVVLENEKVRVLETTWKPGDESASVPRGARVVRSLKGGTLTRIYPDGKKEQITTKTGEVRWYDATPAYALKNETKSTVSLYSVYPK